MPVESDTDRLAMLNDFGVTVVYGAGSYVGIYDRPYNDFGDVAGYAPQLLMRSADVVTASMANGGSITVDGNSFIVREIQADGTGFTMIMLEEA